MTDIPTKNYNAFYDTCLDTHDNKASELERKKAKPLFRFTVSIYNFYVSGYDLPVPEPVLTEVVIMVVVILCA